MAISRINQAASGMFTEKTHGRIFEFKNGAPCHWAEQRGATHTVFVREVPGGKNNKRPARVLKTVAYVGVDESDDAEIVWQKWDIKQHQIYPVKAA